MKTSDNSGNDITANPIVKTSYGYTNRELDIESGMMYYRARYYMSEIGRFINEDSHQGESYNPVTKYNKYIYAGNNPLRYIDPDGRFFITAAIIGGVLGGYLAHTSGTPILEGILIGAVTGAIGAWAGSFGVYAAGGSAWLASLTGLGIGAVAGGIVGGIIGGNLAVMRGDDFQDGSIAGSDIGAASGLLGGALVGYVGLRVDKIVYEAIEDYVLNQYFLLKNDPWAFLKANSGLVVGGVTFLASEIYCRSNEEYKKGVGCVTKE